MKNWCNMIAKLIEAIELSICIEYNIGAIYSFFHESFPEDSEFWSKLALEEKNHAALFEISIEILKDLNQFPQDFIVNDIKLLEKDSKKTLDLIYQYQSSPPNREQAFNKALEIENTETELQFQTFMDNHSDNKIERIFREINESDKDHAKRLLAYMKKHDILINEANRILKD